MLSEEDIHKQAERWQIKPLHAAREYFQHVFLSFLYQEKNSEKLPFKGGTALRIVHLSPRFSEDLDFTGNLSPFHIAALIQSTALKIKQQGFTLAIEESKPTTGGHLTILLPQVHQWKFELFVEISLRHSPPAKDETRLITPPFLPPYTLTTYTPERLVGEKVQAFLTRCKPRDFYDLYFILRKRLGIRVVIPQKEQLLKKMDQVGMGVKLLKSNVEDLLPKSHQGILKQLPGLLRRELENL